jgi:hypothetical protein
MMMMIINMIITKLKRNIYVCLAYCYTIYSSTIIKIITLVVILVLVIKKDLDILI